MDEVSKIEIKEGDYQIQGQSLNRDKYIVTYRLNIFVYVCAPVCTVCMYYGEFLYVYRYIYVSMYICMLNILFIFV